MTTLNIEHRMMNIEVKNRSGLVFLFRVILTEVFEIRCSLFGVILGILT